MVVRPAPQRPAEQPLVLADRQVVDAGVTFVHQSLLVERPVLVAVGAEPVARVVVPFIGEAHGDAVAGKRPEFLDQPVLLLALPLAAEEFDDPLAAADEGRAIAPDAVGTVGQRDALRVAAVPAVLGGADLLRGGFGGEGGKRGTDVAHGGLLGLRWFSMGTA